MDRGKNGRKNRGKTRGKNKREKWKKIDEDMVGDTQPGRNDEDRRCRSDSLEGRTGSPKCADAGCRMLEAFGLVEMVEPEPS